MEKLAKSPSDLSTDASNKSVDPFDKSKIYPTLEVTMQDFSLFYKNQKHFFIFSSAGKPIYSRNGDVFHLSPMFATFSALIPKII